MKLKDITTDLELAKQLKEAGFPQDGLFCYYINQKRDINEFSPTTYPEETKLDFRKDVELHSDICEIISAPITDELLKELPICIQEKGKIKVPMNIRRGTKEYWIDYSVKFRKPMAVSMQLQDDRVEIWAEIKEDEYMPAIAKDKKFPNTLARMWLHLEENNLLEEKK